MDIEEYLEERMQSGEDIEVEDSKQYFNITSMGDCMADGYNEMQEAYNNRDGRHEYSKFPCESDYTLKSGLSKFDREYGAWHAGELVVATAVSWEHLSIFGMNVVAHNIYPETEESENYNGLVFSLRKPITLSGLAFFAFQSGVSLQELRKGDFEADQWRCFASVSAGLLEISDMMLIDGIQGIKSLKAACYLLRKKNNLKVVVVDGLDMLNMHGSQVDICHENMCAYIDKSYTNALKELKELAVELDVLMIVSMLDETAPSIISGPPCHWSVPDTVLEVAEEKGKLSVYVRRHHGYDDCFYCDLIKVL